MLHFLFFLPPPHFLLPSYPRSSGVRTRAKPGQTRIFIPQRLTSAYCVQPAPKRKRQEGSTNSCKSGWCEEENRQQLECSALGPLETCRKGVPCRGNSTCKASEKGSEGVEEKLTKGFYTATLHRTLQTWGQHCFQACMVAHTCNSSSQEAEAGEQLQSYGCIADPVSN